MTEISRTDADWTVEGRAALGHEVLDLACVAGEPFGIDGFVYTGWYAWRLGIDSYRQATVLRPLMARMARHGLLAKAGQAELGNWYNGNPCYWRLAIDRHEAHERWSDVTRRRGWWTRP